MKAACIKREWLDNGQPLGDLGGNPFTDLNLPFRHFGLAQVQTVMIPRAGLATLIQWDTDSVSANTLDYLAANIGQMSAPFFFRFYKRAWFTEKHLTLEAAARRLDELKTLHKLAVPLDCYLTPKDPKYLPERILAMAKDHRKIAPHLVASSVDNSQRFPISRIGHMSLYASLTGQSGAPEGGFEVNERFQDIDDLMTRPYHKALESGEPYWDEYLGFIPSQGDNEAFWLRANRILIPHRTENGEDEILTLAIQGASKPDLIVFGAETGFETPHDIFKDM